MNTDLALELEPCQRVYKVQCFTWAWAIKFNLATSNFRCLPAHRNDDSLASRKLISDHIWLNRKLARLRKLILTQLSIVGAHNPITGHLVDAESYLNLLEQLHFVQDLESRFL